MLSASKILTFVQEIEEICCSYNGFGYLIIITSDKSYFKYKINRVV